MKLIERIESGENIEIKIPLIKLFLSFLFFVILSVILLLGSYALYLEKDFVGVIILILCSFFSLWMMIYLLEKIFFKRLSLKITSHDITFSFLAVELTPVLWGDIKNIEIFSEKNNKFLGINLKKDHEFFEKQESSINKIINIKSKIYTEKYNIIMPSGVCSEKLKIIEKVMLYFMNKNK